MSSHLFALRLQRLRWGYERVLVISQIATARSPDGWIDSHEILDLFEAFKLPAPGNLSRDLATLQKGGLMLSRTGSPRWSLQPEGRERVRELMAEEVDGEGALGHSPNDGALLGDAQHLIIPPELAPASFQPGIQRLLAQAEFERNVFCMTRFPDTSDLSKTDPVSVAIPVISESLDQSNFTLQLASDRQLDDGLFGNIAAHMWACKYGIGIFEDRAEEGLNYNLVLEVGAMLATGRRCCLLKDKSIPHMPTDLVGHIYKEVDLTSPESVRAAISEWISKDIGAS